MTPLQKAANKLDEIAAAGLADLFPDGFTAEHLKEYERGIAQATRATAVVRAKASPPAHIVMLCHVALADSPAAQLGYFTGLQAALRRHK